MIETEEIVNGFKPLVDMTTKNKSFLAMQVHLRKLGIENNRFFLKLYDPSLKNVNPHDKNLTVEQQGAILREIMVNKWYFIREVIRIPVAGGLIPYELNRGNLALSWCKEKNLNTIILMPRQNGKTIGSIIDDIWVYHFGSKNSNFIYSNKSEADAMGNLKRFKDITKALPSFIRDTFTDIKKDVDNKTEIVLSKLNNSIRVISCAIDESQAQKLGRGLTTPILISPLYK
jgi:hypothetical protein